MQQSIDRLERERDRAVSSGNRRLRWIGDEGRVAMSDLLKINYYSEWLRTLFPQIGDYNAHNGPHTRACEVADYIEKLERERDEALTKLHDANIRYRDSSFIIIDLRKAIEDALPLIISGDVNDKHKAIKFLRDALEVKDE